MELWCWHSLHLHHRERGNQHQTLGSAGQGGGLTQSQGMALLCPLPRVGALGVPAPLRQEGHALIPGAGSRSRQVWEEQGPWRPVEIRKCQGKAGQEQKPSFEQVERDLAGAGMGPGHVGCPAESSFRLQLWARCHGQAGRAEVRRSLGDARVWAHTAACLSPGHCRAGSREHLCSDGTQTQLHLNSCALSMVEDPGWWS